MNLSDSSIVFPADFGLRIFVENDQGWELAENEFWYGEGEELLPARSVDASGLDVPVAPVVRDLNHPMKARIVVVGHVKGKPQEQVGAYLDVEIIQPKGSEGENSNNSFY